MGNIIERYHSTSVNIREAIKTLRTNIQFVGHGSDIKTLMLTSTFPNEAKTTTSIYLALSMAEAGKRVLLIDCDLRRPMMGEYMQIKQKLGLSDYISENCKLDDIIHPTECENLFFIDSGPKVLNSVEVVGSVRFENLITDLREEFDYVIIDTPPLGSFIDSALIGSLVDGTILIIEHGKIESKVAKSTIEQLKKAHAHILGVVYTNIDVRVDNYYGNYGQYGYYSYSSSDKSKKKFGIFKKKHHHHHHHHHSSESTDTKSVNSDSK